MKPEKRKRSLTSKAVEGRALKKSGRQGMTRSANPLTSPTPESPASGSSIPRSPASISPFPESPRPEPPAPESSSSESLTPELSGIQAILTASPGPELDSPGKLLHIRPTKSAAERRGKRLLESLRFCISQENNSNVIKAQIQRLRAELKEIASKRAAAEREVQRLTDQEQATELSIGAKEEELEESEPYIDIMKDIRNQLDDAREGLQSSHE